MVKMQGYKVGYTTSDGVYIQNKLMMTGDCTGPASAEFVLRDPTVDFAVLESARGGLLRAGLGFHHCDIYPMWQLFLRSFLIFRSLS